jgi:hypothetical protein
VAQRAGLLRRLRERFVVAVDPDDLAGRERLAQQPERLALAAARIEEHRRGRQRRGEEPLQVGDRHPEHVMLPGVRAQEPDAEAGFGNIGGSVRAVGRHGPWSESGICLAPIVVCYAMSRREKRKIPNQSK